MGSGHRYGSAATNATIPIASQPATGASHRAMPPAVRRVPSGRVVGRVRHSQSTTIASPATP